MELKTAYAITQKELERITGGTSIEELVEAIDETLLFMLFNSDKVDLKEIKGHPWSLQLLKKFLLEIEKQTKE